MDEKQIYKIMMQTDGITITGQTNHAVTEEEANEIAEKDVAISANMDKYKKYITLPVATEEAWEEGHMNFCPRCGTKYESDSRNVEFECLDCGAYGEVYIHGLEE